MMRGPRLELCDWRMVEVIAKESSLTRAADQLCLSQSALSRRLINLEQNVGVRLFDRVGKRMRATHLGEALAAVAPGILAQCREAERSIEMAASHAERIAVRVAAGCVSYYAWLATMLAEFGAAHPQFDIRVQLHATGEELRALDRDLADIAVTAQPARRSDLEVVRLFASEVVVVAAPGGRIAQRYKTAGRLTWRDLADETILIHDLPSTDEMALRKAIWGDRPAMASQDIRRVQLTEAIVALVKSHFGVAVINRPIGPSIVELESLQVLPLSPRHERPHWAAWLRKNPRDLPFAVLAQHISASAAGFASHR
jgi:LysR family transcriptional regulator, regulator for metE and metH